MKSISLLFLTLVTVIYTKTNYTNSTSQLVPPKKGLHKNLKIDVSGVERDYHLYMPQNTNNAPIVILLHGSRSDNDKILGLNNVRAPYKAWLTIAEQENIILIIPKGLKGTNRYRGWNDCRKDARGNPYSKDVLFINNLIDHAVTNYQANSSKVFAVGTSNGGHMAIRLAQEIPDKLKAFASIVAANPVNSKCTNSTTSISALFMNGTDDPILPYEGGKMKKNRGEVYSSEQTIDYWVHRNGIKNDPEITDIPNTNLKDRSTITKYLYTNDTNTTEVAFFKVKNGGHTEPSISERYRSGFRWIVGEQNGDIEMANEVWRFFKTK